jgi:RNA polymerase sigma factor (sigma-70 family)
MRPRHSPVELFSTFLEFDSDRFQGWAVDPRLRRSMERALAQAAQTAAGASAAAEAPAETEESYWALYWHKIWQTGAALPTPLPNPALAATPASTARAHLIAYVQETCYWVAQKTANSFGNLQYSLADLFQMTIAQVDKVLKGFDAQQGFSLRSYASVTLNNLIRESLRQRQEVDICTDWALLRKLSQKRLVEALQTAGLSGELNNYLRAWNCFKALYVPQQAAASRQLAKPEPAVWEAIAQLYRQDCSSSSANAAQLEQWLATCAKAARAYLYPSLVSINSPKPGYESGEFLDDLSEACQTESLLSDLISVEEMQERQDQRQQLSELLRNAIQQLDPESRQLMQLYYQEGLTQQQLADQMQLKQYTISRRLTRLRESLLIILAKWSQSYLHIPPSTDLLTHTSAALDEWLQVHYAQSGSLASCPS